MVLFMSSHRSLPYVLQLDACGLGADGAGLPALVTSVLAFRSRVVVLVESCLPRLMLRRSWNDGALASP